MTDLPSGGERVARFVERIASGAEFPALSERIRDVVHVLSGEDQTMQHLANIVLKDYGLTAKVLRTANSFHYNRSCRPVLSVTQAMVLLGVENVRHLASSLLLFEHYRDRSPGLEELMILSMLTAAHARHTAETLGYPRPEEAYVCGMFRNLGEVLVACHGPAEYAAIRRRVAAQERAADACLRVLGFRYEDLGRAVCDLWSIPASAPGATARERQLLDDIVAFSHDLTTSVYRRHGGDEEVTLTVLVQKHGGALDLTPDGVSAILHHGLTETREVFESLSVSIDDFALRRRSEAALASLAVPPTAAAPMDDQAEPASGPVVRDRLLESVEAALESGRVELNEALLTLLEAALRGGPFDHAVFCVVESDRAHVRGRFGLGADVEARLARSRFAVSLARHAQPAGAALVGGVDLVVTSSRALSADEAQLLHTMGAETLLLFPVTVGGRLVGAVYADRQPGAAALDSATTAFLRRVRELTATAIARARGRTVASGARRVEPATKYEAVLRVLRGEAPETVSRELRVCESDVERWRNAFLDAARSALADS
jgi:HD-like signal output (HDOD) protein